ncbi:DUF3389 family protein [Shewanella sp. Isolate11]|uniref:DUF3389 family protein n=1 Tax=Shewanella sp. Isolate11 TaxID=2908530 RepID=UPI001EFC6FC4|nr:DUF3389 family protein [Shewanella sp. Isolate11]MCG9696794.1 DUF3389 domain-containing protein [Shewanella sp. Isolate11]
MVIEFSKGRLILTNNEIQAKLNQGQVTFYAMAEDLKVISDALLLVADAGAVRWTLTLDNREQLDVIIEQLQLI